MKIIHLNQDQLARIKEMEVDILQEVDRICRKHGIKYILAYGTLLGAVRHSGFIPWDDDIDVCMLRDDYNRFRKVCRTELGDKYFYQTHATDPEYYHLFDKIRLNGTVFKESFLQKYNIHHGVYIDIFPVDRMPENKLSRGLFCIKHKLLRTVLYSKYLDIEARGGKKKYMATVIQWLFRLVSMDELYQKATNTNRKYVNSSMAGCLASPYFLKDIFPASYYSETIDCEFEGLKLSMPAAYDKMLRKLYGDYLQIPSKEKQITRHDLTELKL